MSNIKFSDFEKQFGAEAMAKFAEVCAIGGFGTVSPSHEGGLDLSGLEADVRRKIDEIIRPKSKQQKGDNE